MAHRRHLIRTTLSVTVVVFTLGFALYAFAGRWRSGVVTASPTALAVPAAQLAGPIGTPGTPPVTNSADVAALRARLGASIAEAHFTPTAPGDLAGLKPGAFTVEGPEGGPVISYYLSDPNDKRVTIHIRQSAAGFGTVGPLPNSTSTTIDVLGAPARLQTALPTGDTPLRQQLTFRQDGIAYLVTSYAVPLATVLRIIGSCTPIR